MLTKMKRWLCVGLATVCSAGVAVAQVPSGAVPVTLKQVNTLAGITTWTFSDSAGKLFYLQSPAYIVLQVPSGASTVAPVPAPGLWSASAVVSPVGPTQSPDLTAILNNDGKSIIDALGQKWTVVNGVVLMNGTAIGFSSGVVKLVIVKGVLWQQNTVLNWYYWNVTAKEWDGGAAPI